GGPGGAGAKGGTGNAATAVALTPETVVRNSAIFGGTAACKPATLSEVAVGNVSTLSGVLGELFAPIVPALDTFVASQNACGGLNGHKIAFFQADDQGDPSTAITKVTDLITKRHVLAFVGNIQVMTVDAVIPTVKKYGIPLIGGDIATSTWFSNPLLFPQGGPPQSVSYGHLLGATRYHHADRVGHLYCIEVARSCNEINRALMELAPGLGATMVKEAQASITSPSYVSQCLDFQNAKVEALVMSLDAASMARLGRSCEQVGYHPKLMAYPLAVGNEKQFLGSKWLANTYVPMNVFPWTADATPAQRYFHAMMTKYNPGVDSGGAASIAWTAGALLVAASADLSPVNPTTQQFLDALWQFRGQKFTELGGLSGPKSFRENESPRVPYCLFAAVSNDDDSGWRTPTATPTCSDVVAPSDPQAAAR
ncbi:MAG TPA: ABC transporter substrate-binding protein, partial [Sporichthya sp.]|nr:ABC transporter substrate-binding protein [Sporichthya sp.]